LKNETAIEVKNVKKKFKVYLDKGRSLKEKVLFQNRNRYETRWVLNGISFSVKKGEAVGLIGHNGCGKSTTLKLLTQIMYPDEGSIEIKGRVSSLIELGAGFHPDMSGRENIYTNASIFGLTRKEIDDRMKDIIEFSELEEFLDNPVRTYSSGMYMRLAFSVAINVDADVLLIDEILAVGDINFQAKCFNKLKEIKSKGTTIIIVSHSLGQIEQFCDRTIWIQDGLIKVEGTPRTVHPEYMDFMGHKRQEIISLKENDLVEENQISKENDNEINTSDNNSKRWGNGNARIVSIITTDSNNEKRSVFKTGESIILTVHYQLNTLIHDAVFGIGIFRMDGVQCYGTNTRIDLVKEFDLDKSGSFTLELERVLLLPGAYFFDIAIEHEQGIPVDYFREAYKIEVYSPIGDVGVSRIKHKWIF
jgi:ABC-type polysaccharide/polyol phosphate transport system, ATPase component